MRVLVLILQTERIVPGRADLTLHIAEGVRLAASIVTDCNKGSDQFMPTILILKVSRSLIDSLWAI